jgi:hypothetical protein
MHGGYPQELELPEENKGNRGSPSNRLPMQMSHGQLATTSMLTTLNRASYKARQKLCIIDASVGSLVANSFLGAQV